jgi:hypothetical protein
MPSARSGLILVLAFVGSLCACAERPGPEPLAWGALRTGPNAVGFGSWVERDSTRPGGDGDGDGDGGARPVQVAVWFPVDRGPPGEALRWSDYVGLAASESGGPDGPRERERAVDDFSAFLTQNGVPAPAVRDWMTSGMRASRRALVTDPTLPLVLIAQGNGQAAYSQAVLSEYLASRGFVVVTTPSPLRTGATLSSEAEVYGVAELQARDLAFAARAVTARGLGDSARVAVVGHSFGARAALLLLAQGVSTELISLDGGIAMEEGKHWLDGSPVAPGVLRGRITHLYEDGDPLLRPDFDLLRAMTGTSRERILVPGLAHWQFTSFGTMGQSFPDVAPGRAGEGSGARAAAIVRFVACRLDAWAHGVPDGARCVPADGALVMQAPWPVGQP